MHIACCVPLFDIDIPLDMSLASYHRRGDVAAAAPVFLTTWNKYFSYNSSLRTVLSAISYVEKDCSIQEGGKERDGHTRIHREQRTPFSVGVGNLG